MIDYALVLRLPAKSDDTATADNDGHDGSLAEWISRFVDQLSARISNQSTYGLLKMSPTSVLVVTMVALKKGPECEVQLDIWLASWFLRVELFPPLPEPRQGQQQASAVPSVPLVLIVVADSWELWFASRGETYFEICGPLKIGCPMSQEYRGMLSSASRFASLGELGVVRLLEWVEDLV